MPEPREAEQLEQTLLPENASVPLSEAPSDTPVHPGMHDVTVKPPASLLPGSRSLSSLSVTEVDATRSHTSGTGVSAASSAMDVTQVPTGPRTISPDKTVDVSSSASLSSPAATGTQVGRFALKALHARGGLGEVFTARDTELNREVAVKRIQTRYADDAASRRRFLTEAEITARLDHPGVVPVFGLVADGLGRPCYAMRFIRGESLKEEIERYYGSERGKSLDSPGEESKRQDPKDEVRGQPRSVAFRHLLQRFIAVCQAIGYAHARKVIHRDIKPANVMVGAFGETLVVDWGLAKAMDDSPDPAQILKAAAANSFRRDPDATELPDHLTMAGTAVGTPAYMSPEQASGRLDLVGPAADIYSLGATLFAILTGKAPFVGNTSETLEKVRRGEFPAPKSMNPETPAPLDAVCRKAMALRPDDRYATALELSVDIERWLSDEPLSSYRDPFAARLARWARRHPARVATGGSLLLAGVLGAGGVAWALNKGMNEVIEEQNKTAREKVKVEAERNNTQEAYGKLDIQMKETEKQFQATIKAWNVAENRYTGSVKAFNTLVVDIQKNLADQAGTQDFRQALLKTAQEGLQHLIKNGGGDKIEADRTLVAAHRQMGDVYRLIGNTREARREYDQAVLKAIDVVNKTRDPLSTENMWLAKQDLGESQLRLADIQLQTGDTSAAKLTCEDTVALFLTALNFHPNDRGARENLAAARDLLGDILIVRGETGGAAEQCRLALGVRRQLVSENKSDPIAQQRLADSLDQYGEILHRAGRNSEALDQANECLTLRQGIYGKQPEQPEAIRELAAAHSRLGDFLFDRDDLDGGRKHFEDSRDLLTKLHGVDSRSAGTTADLAGSYSRLAAVALRAGNLENALKYVKQSLSFCEKLIEADPHSTPTIREFALSKQGEGDVLLARGRNDEAVAAYQESVDLLGPIARNDPASVRAKLALAHALERLGAGQLTSGNPAAAIASLSYSIDLRDKVLAVDLASARTKVPGVDLGSARAKRELALGLGWLSDAYSAARQFVLARQTVTREITLLQQVVELDTKNGPVRRELALATGKWGEVLAEEGKPTVALIALGQSLDQLQVLANVDTKDARAQADLATGWERLAKMHARLGQKRTALTAAYAALKIRVELAKTLHDTKAANRELAIAKILVADIYTMDSEFDRARDLYKSASELLDPDPVDAITSVAVRLVKDRLAMIDAAKALTKGSDTGLDGLAPSLHIPALEAAIDWLLTAKKPNVAASLAWKLATLAKTPEESYEAARALSRCGDSDEAVKTLQLAASMGFRDVELLSGTEWDSCRSLKAFQQVLKSIAEAKPLAPNPRLASGSK
jgi:serine/threonine protein kinase